MLIELKLSKERIGGEIEVDESYFGAKEKEDLQENSNEKVNDETTSILTHQEKR